VRSLQCRGQQHASLFPVPADGALGDAQCFTDLLFSKACEVTHLDDANHPFVHRNEFLKRLVHAQDLLFTRRNAVAYARVERNVLSEISAALGGPRAYEIDDDGAHSLTRVSEIAIAIFGDHTIRPCEPKVGLIHERGGVEQCIAPAAGQPGARKLTEIFIQQSVGFFARLRVSLMGAPYQSSKITHNHSLAQLGAGNTLRGAAGLG